MLDRSNVLITIGLEIHSQINSDINLSIDEDSKSCGNKLFSKSTNDSKADIPNSHINYIDLAMPGTLPQLNMFCLQQAIKTGLALNATIPSTCEFDRKHYFYPDLPFGFQITQNFHPIIQGGYIVLNSGKKIRIHHIHVEADAGQSVHKDDYSLINFNRAMVGLMEVVTEPDMSSITECIEFIKKLRLLMQYIKTCNGNMEEGNFRVDVNISIRKHESDSYGTRVEMKNLNSYKFIEAAINTEVERQIEIINSGKKVIQETRGFDSSNFTSYSLRKKETAPEYRYIKEPNLPPVIVTDQFIKNLKDSLEELPESKKMRYKMHNLEDSNIDILLENFILQDYFENLLKLVKDKNTKIVIALSNWVIGDLYGLANKLEKSINDYEKEYLISIITMIYEEKISGKVGKILLEKSWIENLHPEQIVEKENLWQITDISLIDTYIQEVLVEQSKKYEEYKQTKDDKCLNFLVGCILKKTAGKGAPNLCKERLVKVINLN